MPCDESPVGCGAALRPQGRPASGRPAPRARSACQQSSSSTGSGTAAAAAPSPAASGCCSRVLAGCGTGMPRETASGWRCWKRRRRPYRWPRRKQRRRRHRRQPPGRPQSKPKQKLPLRRRIMGQPAGRRQQGSSRRSKRWRRLLEPTPCSQCPSRCSCTRQLCGCRRAVKCRSFQRQPSGRPQRQQQCRKRRRWDCGARMASGIAHSSRAAVPAGPAPAMDRSESESPAWRRRGWRWADAETSEGRALA